MLHWVRGVFVVLALLAGTVAAKANDPLLRDARINVLFKALKSAKSEGRAHAAAAQIWALWFQSGNAEVDQTMAKVQIAIRARKLDLALDLLGRVVQVLPEYAEGWNRRATVYFLMGRDAESVADIQKVLEIEPRHFGALTGLGLIHMRASNWKSAIASFKRALEVHPYLRERRLIPQLEKKLKGREL